MLTIRELHETFKKYDFRPLKRFGENYLIDGNIKDKILRQACLKKDDVVVEIGPGLGALTFDIAASGAKIIAVEKDPKAFNILVDMAAGGFANLEIINGDILEFELEKVYDRTKIKVIGNLPYYITTPIIEYLIERRELIEYALIMVQREVAERLMAAKGSKAYSSLSCFAQYYTEPKYVYTVKRTSFNPLPEVDSSILMLKMRQSPPVKTKDEKLLFRLIRGSFNQRRKSVINSMSREEVLNISKDALLAAFNKSGIDPSARPESLSLDDFARLANHLSGVGQ